MIRPATKDDIPQILALGHLLHTTTSFATKAMVPEKVAAFVSSLIDGGGCVFVADVGGELVGGLMGAVTDQWFNDDLIAYEYSFFLKPGHGLKAIKLMRAFELWAKGMGAKEIYMGIGTKVKVEGTQRLYESMGFELFGPMLVKEV